MWRPTHSLSPDEQLPIRSGEGAEGARGARYVLVGVFRRVHARLGRAVAAAAQLARKPHGAVGRGKSAESARNTRPSGEYPVGVDSGQNQAVAAPRALAARGIRR